MMPVEHIYHEGDEITFKIGSTPCSIKITKVSSFSNIPHYGFHNIGCDNEDYRAMPVCGWIPCRTLDHLMTGK